jgi:Ca2+-binding EF-hand superfamily protein
MRSKTRFSSEELKHLYQGFKAHCPEGVAKEETFKEIYAQFFPPGG